MTVAQVLFNAYGPQLDFHITESKRLLDTYGATSSREERDRLREAILHHESRVASIAGRWSARADRELARTRSSWIGRLFA